ncbi:MAG: hypothetical protein M1812_007112 [Candelaria pacifica]|nr:MAG: hypothetical protein M1812_007112 [Candelaria pacifica]
MLLSEPLLIAATLALLHYRSTQASPTGLGIRTASDLDSRDTPNFYDHSDIKSWAALGDSYSSGIGVGSTLTSSGSYGCSRYDGGYPTIINTSPSLGDGNRKFQYFACSGATTSDVLNKQLSSLDKPQMVTLTAGGNDVGLTEILNQCIYQWGGKSNQCENALVASEKSIDSTDFASNLDRMLRGVQAKLADKDARIYYVGYAKFFGIGDNLCDSVTWSCFSYVPWTAEYLLQTKRVRMNGLVDKVNDRIQAAIKRIGPQVVYVDWDSYVSQHNGRFCEVGVNEKDQKVAGNREGLVFFEWYTTADDYSSEHISYINDGDKSKDGTFEGNIKDLILQTKKENPGAKFNYDTQGSVNVQSSVGIPDGYGRIFHPRVLAHQIIAEKVLNAMDLDKAQKNGQKTLPTKTVGCDKFAAVSATMRPSSTAISPAPYHEGVCKLHLVEYAPSLARFEQNNVNWAVEVTIFDANGDQIGRQDRVDSRTPVMVKSKLADPLVITTEDWDHNDYVQFQLGAQGWPSNNINGAKTAHCDVGEWDGFLGVDPESNRSMDCTFVCTWTPPH